MLSPKQQAILIWLQKGNYFEVCSEHCSHWGKLYCSSPPPHRIFEKTRCKLIKEGFAEYTTQRKHGIRWDRFSLTERGRTWNK
ncbi:hypothetical protein IX91_02075 [Vibrio tubiashii ATCC 19109]|uniref:Uncharacterized protein n=2 Tax=Vibrio oreintalis group TaxID=1891919 RepID=F9SZL5_9VIBR|nr:hypothetical protein IX91_02075 [Vibrio tubiashii ATCC 19109]EGU59195.1 hypothetical protein VITU9109_25740 [Vibrio tubiashii ATCC 19109]EIF05285.1 hypothetical protein VT1337_04265 [Vibrio tubiashii NCIMB 1337 = ATCC 19106]NOH24439.1 hypothetical protein [Vibrio europaeus]QJY35186.1 hypothetical protein HOO69_00585 [Vibrio europaeus]